MKLLAKPVDMIVVFRADAKIPRPWKFKLEEVFARPLASVRNPGATSATRPARGGPQP